MSDTDDTAHKPPQKTAHYTEPRTTEEASASVRRRGDHTGSRWGGKVVAILSVIFAVCAVIVIVQYFQKNTAATISATTAGFERPSDDTLRVRIDVTRDDTSIPSYCIVTAMNYNAAEVGRREILIPAGGDTTQRIEAEIYSRDIPVAASVYGCSTTVPSHLTSQPVSEIGD